MIKKPDKFFASLAEDLLFIRRKLSKADYLLSYDERCEAQEAITALENITNEMKQKEEVKCRYGRKTGC